MPVVRSHFVQTIEAGTNQARRMGSPIGGSRMVTLLGENLSADWTVWL